MSSALGKPLDEIRDGENNAIQYDVAYPLRGRLDDAIDELRRVHGQGLCLVPISGASCGGGIFQQREPAPGPVVGLRFEPPAEPRVRLLADLPLGRVEIDEILIDIDRSQVSVGAAVTLEQINRALLQQLGQGYRVAGADLTSYQYAAAGATFMTGGMGPQRRYFSDSVNAAAIHDGERIVTLGRADLAGHAGSYGWSGVVAALRCDYYRFPANEIAFALPVSDEPADIARLLEQLSPWVYLRLAHPRVASAAGADDVILGLEHVGVEAMQPLLDSGVDNPAVARAQALREKCTAAGADGLVFVNGLSDRSIDEFLVDLCDDSSGEKFSIAGIDLEFAEVFDDPDEMRSLREAVPYAARMQSPGGRFVYKNHSDANLRLARRKVGTAARGLWRINRDYVTAVREHFASNPEVRGEILVYGHLNPYGVDPHNRVTMSADDEAAYTRCREFLVEQRAAYYRAMAALDGASFIGGEKTADSEMAIYRALGGPQNAPAELYRRFDHQREKIRAAAPMFNWRAPAVYR